jgi:hypothetical protein
VYNIKIYLKDVGLHDVGCICGAEKGCVVYLLYMLINCYEHGDEMLNSVKFSTFLD